MTAPFGHVAFPLTVASIPNVKGSGGQGEAKLEPRAAFVFPDDAYNFAQAGSDQYRDRAWFVFENGMPVARYINGAKSGGKSP